MVSKTEYYAKMAWEASSHVTESYEQWTGFLKTAGRIYKYSYNDQLMIHTQRPDATACASYDIWNKRMNRYVKRGARGIVLLDTSGDFLRLHYVFDVSDTGTRKNSREVPVWHLNAENEPAVISSLARRFKLPDDLGRTEHYLAAISENLAADYWEEHQEELVDIVAQMGSGLYDRDAFRAGFLNAAASSIQYQTISRCFGNPDDFMSEADFANLDLFSGPEIVNALGTAVNTGATQILREIEAAIRNHERTRVKAQAEPERSQNHDERTDLHPERGLSDSGHSTDRD